MSSTMYFYCDESIEFKADLAKAANQIRKKILSEVRSSGMVFSDGGKWEVDTMDYKQLQHVLVKAFHSSIQSTKE